MTIIAIQTVILNEVEARMRKITAANGYNNTLIDLKRSTVNQDDMQEFPLMFLWTGPDTRAEDKTGRQLRQFDFNLAFFDSDSEADFSEKGLILGCDMYTALYRTTDAPRPTDAPDFELCDLVHSVNVDAISPVVAEGERPIFGCVMTGSIIYNVKAGTIYYYA